MHTLSLRECKVCGLIATDEQTLELFKKNKTAKYGRAPLCKECDNKRNQSIKAQNPEKWLRQKRETYYRSKYNMELSYKEKRVDEGLNCEICDEPLLSVKHTATDHSHTRGHFRGFLCNKCNTGLGKFNDNLELLDKAMKYLIRTEYKVNPETAGFGIGNRLDDLFKAGAFSTEMTATIQAVKDKYPKE